MINMMICLNRFLISTTNCKDPLNHSDPHCWQGDFTNVSFYLANTNYTYKGVWPVGDTGADGWIEGCVSLSLSPPPFYVLRFSFKLYAANLLKYDVSVACPSQRPHTH